MRKVLDHGYVRLVDSMGNDMSVVRAARVSYNAEPRGEEDRMLINYLWRNRHTSPFESVQFTFEVAAPIFVFRQWHRHRTASYNEQSARYCEMEDVFYVPAPEVIGRQSASSKQARDVSAELTEEELEKANRISFAFQVAYVSLYKTYQSMLEQGVPRELARCVLPVALYSRMFVSMNLRNLFHFLDLRLHPHAQYEIRVYAQAMLELIEPVVPGCVHAWRQCQ